MTPVSGGGKGSSFSSFGKGGGKGKGGKGGKGAKQPHRGTNHNSEVGWGPQKTTAEDGWVLPKKRKVRSCWGTRRGAAAD